MQENNNERLQLMYDFKMKIHDQELEQAIKYEELRDKYIGFLFTVSIALSGVALSLNNAVEQIAIGLLVILMGITGLAVIDKLYERATFRRDRARIIRSDVSKLVGGELEKALSKHGDFHTQFIDEYYSHNTIARFLRWTIRGKTSKKAYRGTDIIARAEHYKHTKNNYSRLWSQLCIMIIILGLLVITKTILE